MACRSPIFIAVEAATSAFGTVTRKIGQLKMQKLAENELENKLGRNANKYSTNEVADLLDNRAILVAE